MVIHDPDVQRALAASSLQTLGPDLIERLVAGARLRDFAAGASIHVAGDPAFAELVVNGLVRGFVAAPDGRTMSIRYGRLGSLMGIATLFNDRTPRAHGNTVALVSSRLVAFRPEVLRDLTRRDLHVAGALLAEISARVGEYIKEIEATSFASARQRLARYLLDVASDQLVGAALEARASQEQLAAGAGTVREVVVRILADMRAERLVNTRRGAVELLDPERLYEETYPVQAARI
jgi:CRP-like cAMP-binding protein